MLRGPTDPVVPIQDGCLGTAPPAEASGIDGLSDTSRSVGSPPGASDPGPAPLPALQHGLRPADDEGVAVLADRRDAAMRRRTGGLFRGVALVTGCGCVILALAALLSPWTLTLHSGPPPVSVRVACGSAVLPKHYTAAEAASLLPFRPAIFTPQSVVNDPCNFDHNTRRLRGGLVAAAGVLLLALALRRVRYRWAGLGLMAAMILLFGGLPGLFGGA
jgi:hypothetical protein